MSSKLLVRAEGEAKYSPTTLAIDELPKHDAWENSPYAAVEYGLDPNHKEPDLEGIVSDIKNACSEDPKTKDNPKAALGLAKVPLHLVSPFGLAHEADAMRDGAEKYGAWNFREVPISAAVYIAACKRHLDLWAMGQERASDSGVHHLGHAKACLGLILDSQHNGNLVDDRPKGREGEISLLEDLFKSLERS